MSVTSYQTAPLRIEFQYNQMVIPLSNLLTLPKEEHHEETDNNYDDRNTDEHDNPHLLIFNSIPRPPNALYERLVVLPEQNQELYERHRFHPDPR